MALIHHRKNNTAVYDPFLLNPVIGSAPSALVGTQGSGTARPDATLLRSRASLHATVAVGAPGADTPPESWWAQATLTLYAFFVPSGSTAILPLATTSPNFLGSIALEKQLVASPSVSNEYYVQFWTPQPLVTQTARKGTAPSTAPIINWYVDGYDPTGIFANSWGAALPRMFGSFFSLWGASI